MVARVKKIKWTTISNNRIDDDVPKETKVYTGIEGRKFVFQLIK